MFVFYKATLKISGIQRYKFDSMDNTAYFNTLLCQENWHECLCQLFWNE
jgi:hypothetical protein